MSAECGLQAAQVHPANKIEENFPGQPLLQAEILQTVGKTYRGVGEYDRAIEFLRRSATLRQQHLGGDQPDTLVTLNQLALAYQAAGKLPEAIKLYEKAASGFEQRKFLDAAAATSIRNIVVCFEQLKQFEQAEAWRRKWLIVVKEKSGPESAAYAGKTSSASKRELPETAK